MAARVTVLEVKAILNESELSTPDITTYILSASTMVDAVLGTGVTAIMKEIERWLCAHMIVVTRERMAQREEAGGAKIEYVGRTYAGLRSTSYGQMVIALDTTGSFASLEKKQVMVYAIKSFDS